MSEKIKKTLSTIPAGKWTQTQINKVLDRIEANFKLVPQHLRPRARAQAIGLLEDLTYGVPAPMPPAAEPPFASDTRQLDVGAITKTAAAE